MNEEGISQNERESKVYYIEERDSTHSLCEDLHHVVEIRRTFIWLSVSTKSPS